VAPEVRDGFRVRSWGCSADCMFGLLINVRPDSKGALHRAVSCGVTQTRMPAHRCRRVTPHVRADQLGPGRVLRSPTVIMRAVVGLLEALPRSRLMTAFTSAPKSMTPRRKK